MYGMEVGELTNVLANGGILMATTGELRAIIERLELVDIGDAASYLGEEATVVEESQVSEQTALTYVDTQENFVMDHGAILCQGR